MADAAITERVRIARELHDVVVHDVSEMVVQAAAAREIVRAQPHDAADAIARVEGAGRGALNELRRALGVLRTDDRAMALEPQPTLAGLSLLLERAGGDVELALGPSLDGLPADLQLTAYRIVEDVLADSAGTFAHGAVQTTRDRRAVTVDIRHDGPRPQPPAWWQRASALPCSKGSSTSRPTSHEDQAMRAVAAADLGHRLIPRTRWAPAYVAVTAIAFVIEAEVHLSPGPGGYAVLVGMCLPLAWQRDRPVPAACAIGALMGQTRAVGVDTSEITAVFGLISGPAFCVARFAERRPALAGLVAFAVALPLSDALIPPFDPGTFVAVALFVAPAWALGRAVRSRSRLVEELAAVDVALAAEREAARPRPRLRSASRIARELHDVVAHALSVMVLQAAGARLAVVRAPEASIGALRVVEQAGRDAVAEMGRLLGVLRGDDAAPAGRLPRPCQAPRRMTPLRILIVDDQALVRAGFRLILEAQAVQVVGEAADGDAAVAAAAELQPVTQRGPRGQPDDAVRRSLAELTQQEREILELVAEGMSNAEIADLLVVASSTVKTHCRTGPHEARPPRPCPSRRLRLRIATRAPTRNRLIRAGRRGPLGPPQRRCAS